MVCSRCGAKLAKDGETCWFCDALLCAKCWDTVGHCGHWEADAMNKAAQLMGWKQRAQLLRALKPDSEMLVKLPEPDKN